MENWFSFDKLAGPRIRGSNCPVCINDDRPLAGRPRHRPNRENFPDEPEIISSLWTRTIILLRWPLVCLLLFLLRIALGIKV